MGWTIEFFEDDDGRQPVREWILGLSSEKRASVVAAIETLLTTFGIDVCKTEHGKNLGDGLFELRIRHEEAVIRGRYSGKTEDERRPTAHREIQLRVFCHAYGERVVLLLGGYDKGAHPAPRRQQREIEQAGRRLRAFRLRQQRIRAGRRRRA